MIPSLLLGVLMAGDGSFAADTVRGVVRVVGTGVAVVGEDSVRLGDLQGAALTRVAGLEVTLWRVPEAEGGYRVDHFLVRAAGGVATEDGELAREGAGYLLVTADGRRLALPFLPGELRDRTGSRVWLAGPLDRPPIAFGVIGITRRPEE